MALQMVDQQRELQPPQEKISDLTPEYIALKTNFMANTLPAQEFLTKLFDLDQQDPARNAAIGNIELLEDPQIMEKINATGEAELIHQALDDKSFFRFHHGQILALSGDLKASQTLQQTDSQQINTKIIECFIAGLKKGNAPHYKEDYQPLTFSQSL